MINKSVHNKGIGSKIIYDLEKYLKASNYSSIRLAWAKGNPQAEHFWIKNGFLALEEILSTDAKKVILAEKKV